MVDNFVVCVCVFFFSIELKITEGKKEGREGGTGRKRGKEGVRKRDKARKEIRKERK